MASSGSTRDLHKAIQASLAAPKLPLSDDLIRILDAYLDKHTEHDQAASDRLQGDLLATFTQSVHNKQPSHYACFLAILRQLRPAIRSTAHLLQWWEKLIEPVFDHLGDERGPPGEVLSDIGEFLIPDDEDDDNDDGSGGAQDTNKDAAPYALGLRLLQKWMDVYHVVLTEGYSSGWTKERPIQEVLVLFGKRKPKEFSHVLNDFFVQKFYRTRSISLLSEFIRSQPPHLYLIVKSPLFESLLRCLQNDTSTTVVALALTCLTMLLPNMPGSIVPYLATLFNIYARILFWDREQPITDDLGSMASPSEQSSTYQVWEKCTFSPDIDGLAIPHLLGYFNILYGLYPLNFMDYIRKPQRYLRHANAKDTDDMEVQPSEIRDRSEKYRQCHMLHPNFYSLTIESEKTDFGRWMKSATADVVAECVSLHISVDERHALRNDSITQRNLLREQFPSLSNRSSALPASDIVEEETAPDQIPNGARLSASTGIASLSASSRDASAIMRRTSQSSQPSDILRRDSTTDSPTLGPLLSQTTSRTDALDGSDSTNAVKSSLYQGQANDSVQSLSLSHQESIPERLTSPSKVSLRQPSLSAPSPLHHLDSVDDVEGDKNAKPSNDTLTDMRRQILLLKNDLTFERYMVQQHLAHIGALRRSNVRQAVTEAETQRLILANRTLKQRLEDAKKTEAQVKKEAEMSRNMSRNWGDSLANKLKKLREEHKTWTADEEALRRDLKVSQEDGARLLAVLCEAEVRELKAKQDMQMLESTAAEMDKLKEEVKTLETAKRESQKLETQLGQTQEETAKLEGTLELLQMKLEAREADLARTRTYYQHQVVALNAKLAEALGEGTPGNGVSFSETRTQVDNALTASRAKYLELQKKHARLMRRYTLLESKRLEFSTSPPYDEPSYTGPRSGDVQAAALSDPEMDNSGTHRSYPIAMRGSVGGASSVGSIGSGTQRHRQRVASDAGSFDATSPGTWAAQMSTSIGSAVSSPITVVRRPSTPPGAPPGGEARGDAPGSTSPQAERYYGRGGVQNSLRKERKDNKKSEEPGDKRDKKPTGSGIRGIRGFV